MGSRLRPLIADRPKVLARVGGRPFLAYLLDCLAQVGVTKVILCTGYLGELIREELGASYGPVRLRYSQEPFPLGTGGALRRALPMVDSELMLVLNGDSFCECDPLSLLAWHRARAAQGSIWLTQVDDASRFGSVEVDGRGVLMRFREKEASAGRGWINAGIYLLSQPMVESITPDRMVSLEQEVFPRWAGQGLFGYPGGGHFIDIGTPESYAAAQSFFVSLGNRSQPDAGHGHASRRFVLLDRDGTLNVERHYLSDPAQVELLPGAAEGLKRIRELGLGLIVITNQSAIGRGMFDQRTLEAIHERIAALLAEQGAAIDAIYFCPHRPEEGCECRKPAPGMVRRAEREWDFRAEEAFFIGDKSCDLEVGKRFGARTILVGTGYGEQTLTEGTAPADYAVDNLLDAAQVIEHLLADA
jgi:D-glycero-alpha-D-manno-heptose 1-phosphate guanylyltransferase